MRILKTYFLMVLIVAFSLTTLSCFDTDYSVKDDNDSNPFDELNTDDDDVDENRDRNCGDYCEIIVECRLLQTIKLGLESFEECVEYCLDLDDFTDVDCILDAADCSDTEDCLDVNPFCPGYEGDGRCCRTDDPCGLSDNHTCNCDGACN